MSAKRNPALSKITTETPKISKAATAVHSKPPSSTDVKKTTEKREALKKTPVKKDAPGLNLFYLCCMAIQLLIRMPRVICELIQ